MGARILVVEDEEALTTLLRYNLDAEGYEVETVARGDEAEFGEPEIEHRARRLADILTKLWTDEDDDGGRGGRGHLIGRAASVIVEANSSKSLASVKSR